jgi:Acyl-CoA dehydrogenases
MATGAPSTDLLQIDDELTDEERLIRDTVRAFAGDRVLPHVEDWFEEGTLPRDIMPELGKLGVLGMHLTGYGCAGAGAIAYGVACRELEACDSGLRSAASVQGSLSMYPIWRYGSEEQKTEWLPRMAAGEAVGCFGLTEPDHGSDPGSMRTFAEDGSDWVFPAPRCGSPTAASPTSPWSGPDRGRHPRVPGPARHRRLHHQGYPQETIAARLHHLRTPPG